MANSHRSFLGALFVDLIIVAILAVLLGIAIVSHGQRDLTVFEGMGDPGDPAKESFGGDFVQRVRAATTGVGDIVIPENEINHYLARQMTAEQEGWFSKFVRYRSVGVDFIEGRCQVVVEREVFGRSSTMAMNLTGERKGDDFVFELGGGQYGQLRVPGGVAVLGRGTFKSLAASLQPELQAVLAAGKIEFRESALYLSPPRS